jgi:hypothetical protein
MIEIDDITSKTEKQVWQVVEKKFKEGNKYLLWKLREEPKNKYSYFSIINKIEQTDKTTYIINLTDYQLPGACREEKENSSEIEKIRISLIGLNTKSYRLFILTEEEAKPYLKRALVMSLTNEPKKLNI